MYTECKYGGPLRQTGPSCTKSRLARPQLFPDVLVDMNGCTRAIPQASLARRELQTLKCKELRVENKGSASEEGSKSIKELAETKIWLILILTMCLQSTKNTKRQVKTTFQLLLMHRNQTTLSDGWSGDIKQMPFSMCAQMNNHITKSGKNIDSSKNHSVLTSCHHSFRKNDTPHNLKVALCIFRGEVKNASGQVGFCKHILTLLLKLCKFHCMRVKV
ncbi:hypothetical protein pdam_00025193 [Pocillopora damicornis]|uniref:Uncharacterized protein n=1 Tax=Pocillopora damicornis TaxID=46731 RepID=A0A3M6TN68_POCDA|nr:hypothetical protein pdam_00025193 [Pocillopora damicornis]